jgi:glycine oxidase
MHAVIVGGGIIGLSIAWRSLAMGARVTVVDPRPASEASHASAGMLPPANEMLFEQEALFRLCRASRERYASFAAELEVESGLPSGYSRLGVLDVAFDDAGLAALGKLRLFQESAGIATEHLTAAECLRYEPRLAPSVAGGILAPDDGAVDPRRMTAALLAAIERLGGVVIRERATEVLITDRAAGVRLSGGGLVHGDKTLMAAGCWTHLIGGVPDGVVPPIRPIKGQILRFRSPAQFLRSAVRATIGGAAVYLVPRADGELVVGATYEESGYDTTVTALGLSELTRKLQAALGTSISELRLDEAGAGLRPGSPDDLPVLGETAVPDLLLASGLSRIGVQLAPITAEVIASLLTRNDLPEVAKPFAADRFA